jgi:GntR family transcriptional regulator, rspAB operon transcriptional repressor
MPSHVHAATARATSDMANNVVFDNGGQPDGRRGRLSGFAYKELRDKILSGEIAVGTALAEVELAATLGVSRTPVREALSNLLADGLVVSGPKRQLLVRGYSADHREEVLTVRKALEQFAVSRACRAMSIEEIRQLRAHLQRREEAAALAGDDEEFIALDEDFHLALAQGARLPIVLRMLRQLRGFVRLMSLGAVRPPEHLIQVHAEHQAIVDAIEARDEERALKALATHLHHSSYGFAQQLAEGETAAVQ